MIPMTVWSVECNLTVTTRVSSLTRTLLTLNCMISVQAGSCQSMLV